MSTAAEAEAGAAPTEAPPLTADEAEALARDLDRQRAEIARQWQQLDRNKPGQIDREWTAAMQAVTVRGRELDRQRGAAWKTARQLHEREASRDQWIRGAWVATTVAPTGNRAGNHT